MFRRYTTVVLAALAAVGACVPAGPAPEPSETLGQGGSPALPDYVGNGPYATSTSSESSTLASTRLASSTVTLPVKLPPPRVDMPNGHVVLGQGRELPIEIRYAASARARVVALKATEFDEALQASGYFYEGDDPIKKAGFSGRARTQILEGDDTGVTRVGFDPFVIGRPKLVYVVVDTVGAAPRAAVVQRGKLSTVLKLGAQSGLAWAVDSSTGKPASGAFLVVRQGTSVRYRGRADKNGLLKLPAESQLRIRTGTAVGRPLAVYAHRGEDIGVTTEGNASGIEPWHFDALSYDEQNGLRGMVTAERGIYRPGDDVHLLGVLRKRLPSGKLRPPKGLAKVTVSDPDGTEISTKRIPINGFGTFRSTVAVPRTARLGRYSVEAEVGEATLRHRFDVGEYRPIRFEVDVPSSKLVFGEDDSVTMPVSASYLYGAPVAGGVASWTVSVRASHHEGRKGFSYGDQHRDTSWSQQASGSLELDADGKSTFQFPRSVLGTAVESQRVDVAVEASVRDPGGDTVTKQRVLKHNLVPTLVGISDDVWVVNANKGWSIEVVAESPDGKAVAGRELRVEVERRRWVSVAEKTAWGTRYRGEYETNVVLEKTVKSGSGPTKIHVDIPGGGNYTASVGLIGETRRASASVWAYGRGASGHWDNNPRVDVRSDKESYEPGEVARLFVSSPFKSATALVTVEREGIVHASVQELKSAETPIDIEIDERYAPNVFASVSVVPRNLGSKSPAAGVPFRMGLKQLDVSPEKRRLRVAVRPERPGYRPGEDARVRVQIRDDLGRPVRGEVTLWAADEGVLALTGYATPDVFGAAYEPFPLQVRTATALLRWAQPDNNDWDGTGGDYAAEGSAFRSHFLSTAFFTKKGVVTDARGEAKVTIPLPDNLTKWRVVAAVADATDRFGSAAASLTTSKPLQITPALPRFMTVGDELDATFVVHNHTGHSANTRVAVSVDGAELASPAEQSIRVSNGTQKAVTFKVLAKTLGDVRFSARASLGADSDAVRTAVPIHPPSLWQSKTIGSGKIGGSTDVAIALPASATPKMAKLTVSVSPGVFASIGGGIDSLLEYPHGCVEQTTSRLIPLVLLEDLLRRSGDTRLAGKPHKSKMNASIAHVLKHQNHDGGFGLWPTSDSEGFLTAYALWGLVTASQNGYSVPSRALERGYAYLTADQGDGDMHGQFSDLETRPFAAYVFAAAARDDSGLGQKLAAERGGLSRFALGLLGTALAPGKTVESKTTTTTLLGDLLNAKTPRANGAIIAEAKSSGTFSYGAPLRATAATVQALIRSGRTNEADKLVAGILAERRKDGSWGTTYNNLWALTALAEYGKASMPPTPSRIRVEIDGRPIKTLTIGRANPLETIELSAADLPKPGGRKTLRLVASKSSSARFEARLRFVDSASGKKKTNHGFDVTRELVDAKTGAVVARPKRGQLLRIRLRLSAKNANPQVALVDRLPAGLEPVDVNLTTSTASGAGHNYGWTWHELHDERVTFFADHLSSGATHAEYLVRATRVGTFEWPAPSAEAMYSPDVYGHGVKGSLTVAP